MPHRHCPPALATMGGESWVIWQLHCSQASDPASQPAFLATPLPQAGLRSEAHPNEHGASYSYAERHATLWSVMLISLGIPSDSSKGTQQTRIFIKVLKYETGWLFTAISKEPKFGLPVYSQWRNNPLWLSCSFNLYLSLWVRLLINVISHTALSHCLAVNSPSLDTLTAHVAFQNRPSETQEPEVSRAHAILLRRAPAATCADSRARGRGGKTHRASWMTMLQSPVTCT